MNEIKSKCIEEAVSHIGAKIANAVDQAKQAKVLSANSEALLIDVQRELEDLYMALDNSENIELSSL
jgi:hypothetical protein